LVVILLLREIGVLVLWVECTILFGFALDIFKDHVDEAASGIARLDVLWIVNLIGLSMPAEGMLNICA